jgi:hypothetical protein
MESSISELQKKEFYETRNKNAFKREKRISPYEESIHGKDEHDLIKEIGNL